MRLPAMSNAMKTNQHRSWGAGLFGLALVVLVSAPGCVSSGTHEETCTDVVTVPIGTLACRFETRGGSRWVSILSADGTPFTTVAFDPESGKEDFSTQGFLGHDEDELLDLGGKGDATPLLSYTAGIASCLWVPGTSFYIGTGDQQGTIIKHAGCSPAEIEVLSRQSQVLSFLVGRLSPPDPSDNAAFARAWNDDNCTLAPDFDFTSACCAAHDSCYEQGGDADAREECDLALCECIADNGYPLLARVYFAAVSAFGWRFFGRRR
jgi:hypothetical protein